MNQDNNQVLALRDNARRELLKIQTAEDGITYLNKLKSIEVWVTAERKDAELQNIVAEQKIRIQRILGELIAEGQRKGTIASPSGDRMTIVPGKNNAASIEDIGLSRKQSSSFQQIAPILEDNCFRDNQISSIPEALFLKTTTVILWHAIIYFTFLIRIPVKRNLYENDHCGPL